MINPQKFSKSVGNSQLKIGLSFTELTICSFIPFTLNLLGTEPFISCIGFVVVILIISMKNKFLEPSYIRNQLEKKTHEKWERVIIND